MIDNAILETLRNGKEFDLRDLKVPWPKDKDEILSIISALSEREHDYGTRVYAMSIAAVAAFNYMAAGLGCTGFQASMADLDILERTRGWKWGKLLDYEHLLYPQYCTSEHFPSLADLLKENREELAKRAAALLSTEKHAHPGVKAHWERLRDAGTERIGEKAK